MFDDLLKKSLHNTTQIPFEVEYQNGEYEKFGNGSPHFKIIINENIPKKDLVDDPSLALGEAYMNGKLDYEGDLQEILETIYLNKDSFLNQKNFISKAAKLKPTSIKKQKNDIQYHYDLGNDFYKLWLDETMSYSCAYFTSPDDSLYNAQLNKINHTLNKLNLQEGHKLLDIGSGWGGVIIEAAKQYGAQTLGITLSEEQYEFTKKEIKNQGVEELADVKLLDYRELADSDETFDRVVSIGMAEHVGKANLPKYMECINKLLKESGIAVLHCITSQFEGDGNKWINKYIFPGGYVPSYRELVNLMPEYDFRLIDAENLRIHYSKTLQHWADNFENNLDKVREKFDEKFVRMWRLFLNSCAASFKYGNINLHQYKFSKGINNELPFTRKYLYI